MQAHTSVRIISLATKKKEEVQEKKKKGARKKWTWPIS